MRKTEKSTPSISSNEFDFSKFDDFFLSLDSLYKSIPSLACGNCKGNCCVCPTMTAPEFVYLIRRFQADHSPDELFEFLRKPLSEHYSYTGNNYCRFQQREEGWCEVYQGRALACRLHGHEALKLYESPDLVFCDLKPSAKTPLTNQAFEDLLQRIRLINIDLNLPYEEPYYIWSLNLDSWIDLLSHAEVAENRQGLKAIIDFLNDQLDDVINLLVDSPWLTTLSAQFGVIDNIYKSIQNDNVNQLWIHLQSVLYDFPSTGSYYRAEATAMLEQIKNKVSPELLKQVHT